MNYITERKAVLEKESNKIRVREEHKSFWKKLCGHLTETAEIVAPGMIVMNNGYYRPHK